MAPHNHDPKDYIVDEDLVIGLVTDQRPESVIQRLYLSGGNSHLITTTIPKSWCYQMNLHPKDYIYMEVSADRSEIKIKKVSKQAFKKEEPAEALPIDSDKAASLLEEEAQKKAST
jgi:bifunctional DNA-binding transcriptional regulator/antitoxin component of YhaV-PrlF toxin-antitoxin module